MSSEEIDDEEQTEEVEPEPEPDLVDDEGPEEEPEQPSEPETPEPGPEEEPKQPSEPETPEPGPEEEPKQPTAALAVRAPRSMLQKPPETYDGAMGLATMLASSSVVPKAYRGKNGDIFVAICMGAELGITPLAALNRIHVVEGKPTMSAEGLTALILEAGHDMTVVEMSGQRCEIIGVRGPGKSEGKSMTMTWTWEEAIQAELSHKDNWKKYPKAMLYARCLTQLSRVLFPDVMMGAGYTPEEIGDEDWVVAPPETVEAVVSSDGLTLIEQVWSSYDEAPADVQEKIDAWCQTVTDEDGNQRLPGGVKDLDAMHGEDLIRRIQRLLVKGITQANRDIGLDDAVAVVEDAQVGDDEEEDIEDGVIVPNPADDSVRSDELPVCDAAVLLAAVESAYDETQMWQWSHAAAAAGWAIDGAEGVQARTVAAVEQLIESGHVLPVPYAGKSKKLIAEGAVAGWRLAPSQELVEQ